MSDTQGKATEISVAEQITALRASRLLNPEMSLRDIVAAAQKIPGLGDGSTAAWELINRDFVYKGRAIDDGDKRFNTLNVQGAMALQDSKILNFDITLGSILDMSAKIPGINHGSTVSWELVTRDFVLRGAV